MRLHRHMGGVALIGPPSGADPWPSWLPDDGVAGGADTCVFATAGSEHIHIEKRVNASTYFYIIKN